MTLEIYSAFSNNNTIPVLFVVRGLSSWHEGLGWIAKSWGSLTSASRFP